MRPSDEAKRLIMGLLAQLASNQQSDLPLDELDTRFDAVMTALDLRHQAGQGLDLPMLLAQPDIGYMQFATELHYGIADGFTAVDGKSFRVVMDRQQIHYWLQCFTPEERDVLQWLAGVYADPSQASHPME